MKIDKILAVCFIAFFSFANTNLSGQIKLGLFSHSEFFYSPNESYDSLKSFYDGYNKTNFSSHLGMSIGFKINERISISVGVQRVNRAFDCDCVNRISQLRDIYYVSDSSCLFYLRATYRILQIPLSIKYSFPSKNNNITHSIGIGNTLIYNLGKESLIYNSFGSLNAKSLKKSIAFFAPEIYYEVDFLLSKHTSANLSLGFREEITKQFNHAFFAKVGISYSMGKEKRKPKRR